MQLIALGAYQLDEAIKAQQHLAELDRCACVTVILEPGRLRIPRDAMEAEFVDDDATVNALFPPGLPRVILTHTRPEPMLGILRRIDSGPARTHALATSAAAVPSMLPACCSPTAAPGRMRWMPQRPWPAGIVKHCSTMRSAQLLMAPANQVIY